MAIGGKKPAEKRQVPSISPPARLHRSAKSVLLGLKLFGGPVRLPRAAPGTCRRGHPPVG
jgi:hypothetical protein